MHVAFCKLTEGSVLEMNEQSFILYYFVLDSAIKFVSCGTTNKQTNKLSCIPDCYTELNNELLSEKLPLRDLFTKYVTYDCNLELVYS